MTDLLESQSILITFLKYSGFFPFQIGTDEWKTSQINLIACCLINTVAITIFLLSSFAYASSSNSFLYDESSVTLMIHILEVCCNTYNRAVFFFYTLRYYGQQKSFLQLLVQIESKVSALKLSGTQLANFYAISSWRIKTWCMINVIFFTIVQILYGTVLMENEPFHHLIQSFLYIIFSFHFVILMTFIAYQVLVLRKCFQLINCNLTRFISHSSVYYEKEIFDIFAIIYDFHDAIDLFNNFYGRIVFANFVFIFGVTSSEIYFSFVSGIFTNLTEEDGKFFIYNIVNISWCAPLMISFFMLGDACNEMKDEVERCLKIMRNNLEGLSCKTVIYVEKFLISFNARDYEFTTKGFFVIDRSIVYNVSS